MFNWMICSLSDGPARGPMECIRLTTGLDYSSLIEDAQTAGGVAVKDATEYTIADDGKVTDKDGNELPFAEAKIFTKDDTGANAIDLRLASAQERVSLNNAGYNTTNYTAADLLEDSVAKIETLQLPKVPSAPMSFMAENGSWATPGDFKVADVWTLVAATKDTSGFADSG